MGLHVNRKGAVEKSRESSSKRGLALVSSLVLVGSLGVAGVAWAAVTDNMFPTANTLGYCYNQSPGVNHFPCQTDNRDVYYYMDSNGEYELETVDRNNVQSVMRNEFAPTDLRIYYDSTPVFSGSGETDIIYQEGSTGMPSSVDGMTWCNDAVDNKPLACDQQYIRIRGNGSYTYGLTCHETGHAVGLQHGDVSSPRLSRTDSRLGCMVTPVGSGAKLGSNNIENINATY
ncbi:MULTISPECIES: hypothetical protein [unclassified Nocardiopsis]|uniref:hypothetical protein n=1 Tax=Nocardiopsis TaxID=2013 RepID=UPI00387B4EBC